MVIFQILLLSDKSVISKERNTVRSSNPRASLTWTDNTSKVGYDRRNIIIISDKYFERLLMILKAKSNVNLGPGKEFWDYSVLIVYRT